MFVGIAFLAVFLWSFLPSFSHNVAGEASVWDMAWLVAWDLLATGVIVGLVLGLPTASAAVRRLHDTDRTGWWLPLWCVAPVAAWIPWMGSTLYALGRSLGGGDPSLVPVFTSLLLGLAITMGTMFWAVKWLSGPGDAGANRFGADPAADANGPRDRGCASR